MVNFTCNSTLAQQWIDEEPLWKGYTFHHFGLFLAAVFGGLSLLITFYLILRHATHYLRPWEQKHIIRILLMMPIYATVSFLSYLYYRHAVYFEVLRDCYEAFAIASFFTLLCHYIAPNLHDQKEYFRGLQPVNWFWGVFGLQLCTGGKDKGPFRLPRSGLTWFNVIWIGVFQYCLVRVVCTIVSVLAEVGGRYCKGSVSPVFAHVWVMVFEGVSVTIAMFCLVQFYIQLKDDLAQHRPFLKVLCIKLVIFFCFWQGILISILTSDGGPLHPTPQLSYPDIKIGIPSVLLCIEMSIFAVMHLWAFPWKPYSLKHRPKALEPPPATTIITTTTAAANNNNTYPNHSPHHSYQGGLCGLKALADAFNPWDIVKASARGFRWLCVGARHRHQDRSYQMTVSGSKTDTARKSGDVDIEETVADGGGWTRAVATAESSEDDREALLRPSQGLAGLPGFSGGPSRGSRGSMVGLAGSDGFETLAGDWPLPAPRGDTFGRRHGGLDGVAGYGKLGEETGDHCAAVGGDGASRDGDHWAGPAVVNGGEHVRPCQSRRPEGAGG